MYDGWKLDVNTLFEKYLSLRKLKESTRANYLSMWRNHIRDNQQFMLGIDRDVEIEGLKDFIFTGKYGKPMMPSAVNNALYSKISKFIKI